jgi:hypothetical protein
MIQQMQQGRIDAHLNKISKYRAHKTNKEFVDDLKNAGFKLYTFNSYSKSATEKRDLKLKQLSNCPLGNKKHPDTIAFFLLRDQIKKNALVYLPVVVLTKGTECYRMTKIMIEYALSIGVQWAE